MTTTHRSCARGCTRFGRHLAACEDQDACRGCMPRDAEHGHLCDSCHNDMERWLGGGTDGAHAVWVHLGRAQGGISSTPTDTDHRGGSESVEPLRLAIFDTRRCLSDRIYIYGERLREVLNMKQPVGRFDIAKEARFLYTRLAAIEAEEDFAAWMYGDEAMSADDVCGHGLQGVMVRAHMVAPWRGAPLRLPAPCPECERLSLVMYGTAADPAARVAGNDSIGCTTCGCGCSITPEWYELWVKTLAEEATA